ncbi:MAG: DNA-processing protein DprA [Gammaproteobacteria bacterium]|nr:DNA-processing protein DprA [Gammaproteobacteria bacterium]
MQTDWLELLHLRGPTLPEKRELVRALGGPAEVLRADEAAVEEVLGKRNKRRGALVPHPEKAEADLAALEKCGGGFVGFSEAEFPPLLNEIPGAPLGLFTLGARELLAAPQLAIVGSREPTPSGRRATEKFAAELSAMGLGITSGMAVGIDHAAHRGCLDAGGRTIAVTACGLDILYPRAHEKLRAEIAERGLLVSEYPPGAPPKREHFPRRNRIISGLSLGVLVVEAGMRSGSLITARLAGEQGREVFAVPGPIHVETSRGCHRLLRQGAKLVECSEDILEELGHFAARPSIAAAAPARKKTAAPVKSAAPVAPEWAPVHDLIDYTPVSIDQIIAQSGLTADKVSHILVQLELHGLIAAAGGGYQRMPQ